MSRVKVFTQFDHQFDDCELCGKFPSLTDPDCEVYSVAELLARHDRGQLTNLNIGRDYAYPTMARLNDRDVEKDMNLEATDRFHLANELEVALSPELKKLEEEKKKKDDEERKAKEDAAFNARLLAEGYVKPDVKKGEEGKA